MIYLSAWLRRRLISAIRERILAFADWHQPQIVTVISFQTFLQYMKSDMMLVLLRVVL